MKKRLAQGLTAAGLTAAALAVPVTSSAIAAVPDGASCQSWSGGSGCTAGPWSADVNGTYGGLTSGSWEVDQLVTVSAVAEWKTVANGGPGVFTGGPGSLTLGGTYRLVINGQGGGSIGSITGVNGAI